MKHVKELLKKYIEADNQILEERDAFVTFQELIDELQEAIKQDEKENGWIPVRYHQISEKEHTEESISKDIHYMLDCKMPDDKQEILVTNGKTTWHDMCCIDSDGYYLDSNYDWIEITAWRPLPEPYKED